MAPRQGDGPESLSVIIPTLNEAARIGAALQRLKAAEIGEVIVVDGGSRDGTAEIAKRSGALVLECPPSRARQQNLGARAAQGPILVFLHADTILPAGFADAVRATLSHPGVSAGAFRFRLDRSGWKMSLVESMVALRCRIYSMPYGDQALFMQRRTFDAIGGFSDLAVMEDFDLVRRLKRVGRIEIVESAAVTSARRWRREGVWQLTLKHQLCILGYYLSLPTAALARLRCPLATDSAGPSEKS